MHFWLTTRVGKNHDFFEKIENIDLIDLIDFYRLDINFNAISTYEMYTKIFKHIW